MKLRYLFITFAFFVLSVLPACAQSSVVLTWDAPPTTGGAPTSYNILRGISHGTEETLASVSATFTTYTDTTPVPGTTYYYEVTATNSAGTSGPSNEIVVSFLVVAPKHPTGLAATVMTN